MHMEDQLGKTTLELVLSQKAWAKPLGEETNLAVVDHVGHSSKGDPFPLQGTCLPPRIAKLPSILPAVLVELGPCAIGNASCAPQGKGI